MVPFSNTGSVPKTVTWYWHFVCTEPNFSTWRDILQKTAFTSWYLTVISWNLVYQRIDNFFSNFNSRQFWSQKQLKTNWAHYLSIKSALSVQIYDNPYLGPNWLQKPKLAYCPLAEIKGKDGYVNEHEKKRVKRRSLKVSCKCYCCQIDFENFDSFISQ